MKKIFAFVTVFTIVSGMAACSAQPGTQTPGTGAQQGSQPGQVAAPPEPTIEEIAAKPFTTDYQYSEAQIKSLTEDDSIDTVAMGGPLYVGNTSYEQPGLKKFQEMKAVMVDNIVKAVDQAEKDAVAYAAALKNLKNKYYDYLGQMLEANNKLVRNLKNLAGDAMLYEVNYTANFALYNSIDTSTKNPATSAFLKYQKTYLAMQNINLLSKDTAHTISGLLVIEDALKAFNQEPMTKIAAQIEIEVPAMVDELGNKLVALQQEEVTIDSMIKQINTAEYYMGKASVQYVEQNLAALRTQADSLVPKGTITADDVQFIKDLVTTFDEANTEIKKQLEGVNTQELLADTDVLHCGGNVLIPTACAQTDTNLTQTALNTLKTVKETTVAGGKMAWSAAKTTFNTAKTSIGVGLDTAGAITKTGADLIYGIGNGNSAGEIAGEVGKNFVQVGKNWQTGKSGTEILTTATGYFDEAEKLGGQAAEAGVEKVVGKGWTSWMAGHVGNVTVNLFTSLGKGITKVANKDSTTGEIIEGSLDIGLSFIGGSKAFVKGSQAAVASKETIKKLGAKGVNFLEKLVNSMELKNLKGITGEILENTKLTPEQVKMLISNSIKVDANAALKQELININKGLNEEIMKMLKEGGATIMENATAGAKKEYVDFVETQFKNSLKGYKDALIKVLGDDFKEYVDNLVANKADDIMKAIIKDYVDKGIIPGIKAAPELKDIAGKWGDGQFVINDIEMTDEFKASAKKEGCDLSELEAQKGKVQKMEMTLTPSGEDGGTMTIKMSDGKSQSVPFTYKEGVLTASMSQEGAVMNMNMNFEEADKGFKQSGEMNIDYMGGGLKIKAATSATKMPPPPPIVNPDVSNPAEPGVAAPTVDIGR